MQHKKIIATGHINNFFEKFLSFGNENFKTRKMIFNFMMYAIFEPAK